MVECYNLTIDEDDDLHNIDIPESEGHCDVHGSAVKAPKVTQPLKTQTINIGSEDQPKYATSGDYWDEDTVSEATQLLHEYRDLCLIKFLEIKGIIEAVNDILSWVEVRLHVADGVQRWQMSLLARSHSYCLCRRKKGLSELKK